MTREVTLIDCLAHRTGLADPDLLSYSGVTRAELLRRMRFLPQIEPFRCRQPLQQQRDNRRR